MRRSTAIALALTLAPALVVPAVARDAQDASAAASPAPTPMLLHADEGEKLLMYDGRTVLLKATAEGAGARELFLGVELLPPGTAIPVHSHEGYEEIIFIHRGTARLTLGNEVVEAGPGAMMYIPPGTFHGVAAQGDDETSMLFIFPETGIGDFFRAVGFAEGEEPPQLTPADWGEIMERHRMRVPER